MVLWFAALFGIGSFVLPAQLFGVVNSQENFGVTTKIVIALVAALIGAALGLWMAHKIKTSQTAAPTRDFAPKLRAADAHPDAPARRPISAMEELGREKLAESVPDDVAEQAAPLRRRHLLSVTDEDGWDKSFGPAPLPGQKDIEEGNDDGLAFSDDPGMLPAAEPIDEVATEAEPAKEQAGKAKLDVEPAKEPADFKTTPCMKADNMPLADRRVEELGIVELVERLAISIKQRKEASISARTDISGTFIAASAGSAETSGAQDQEPLEFRPMPSALQSLMIDEHEEDGDDDAAFPALNLTTAFRPLGALPRSQEPAQTDPPKEVSEELDNDETASENDGYTSLLAIKSPFLPGQEPVLIDEEDKTPFGTTAPAAVPAPRKADPAATEKALRDALSTLRRMSGAA